MLNPQTTTAIIRAIVDEPGDVKVFELAPVEGQADFPTFDVGSHIDLHLPGDLVRSYSLVGQHRPKAPYRLAIARDRQSRGGSNYIHQSFRVGDQVTLGGLRNNFPLVETAASSVFIAGGIGITPMIGMVSRLDALKRPWELYFGTRSRAATPLLNALQGRQGAVNFFHDDENEGRFLDIARIVKAALPNSHFYCCGPRGMLDAFEQATADIPQERVHIETFTAREEAATDGGFEIELRRTGTVLSIPQGKTILEVLDDAGFDVPSSCREGICGTCETDVIEGEPDHRDGVLTSSEKASSKTMMICCSGSKSRRLVLDL